MVAGVNTADADVRSREYAAKQRSPFPHASMEPPPSSQPATPMGPSSSARAVGLTLLVLLLLIIGVAIAAWGVSWHRARMPASAYTPPETPWQRKADDAKRASDIKQIQTALALYYNDVGQYPVQDQPVFLGEDVTCLGSSGFSATTCTSPEIMSKLPRDSDGPGYRYSSWGRSDQYCLEFTLTGEVSTWPAGVNHVTQDGHAPGACPSLPTTP